MEDNGHIELITDLGSLYTEAIRYQFHDFKNDKYALPKTELLNKLNDLATYVKEGKYDN